MLLNVTHQEQYSRGELLLRSFFGFIYIGIPHGFLLAFMGLWGSILSFISFWAILFTGRYPESFFEYQVNLIKWRTRVNATLYNLIDGYPAFGLDGSNDGVEINIEYPESMSRGHALVKAFFGMIYCGLPHAFVLYFRLLATMVLMFLAWWSVLFTGSYPKSWHEFTVGTLRWGLRLGLYLGFMTDKYPPFTGKELQPVTVASGNESKSEAASE